jgi:hypothetical protein
MSRAVAEMVGWKIGSPTAMTPLGFERPAGAVARRRERGRLLDTVVITRDRTLAGASTGLL